MMILSSIFLSCSHADNFIEEYVIEIDQPDTFIINRNDTVSNDSTNSYVISNDSLKNEDSTTANKKDTIIVSYESYMNLVPSISYAQGAACYDKYLFQGYGSNPALEVYDLEKKEKMCKINISDPKPDPKIHANSVCFGNQKYAPEDFFPLLYISSGYTTTINGYQCSYIYVFRIRKDDSDNFNITHVQTITLKGFVSWTEGIPDNENNKLWIKYQPNGTYAYVSFKMPKLENGDIILTKEDVIDEFSLGAQPFKSSNQGHIFYKDKILLVSGTAPPGEKIAFIMINTLTCKRELVIDLNEIGLYGEPESVFFYKNQFMIGYRNRILKFNLRKASGERIL